MKIKKYLSLIIILSIFCSISSCSSGGGDNIGEIDSQQDDGNNDGGDTDSGNDDVDNQSLATNGCQNVVIVNGHAYAACGAELEVISLSDGERNLIQLAADDITADADAGLLFTQSRNILQLLSLTDPMNPEIVMTLQTNFSTFSGLSAANGVLVVSAGAGGSNTQIYTYTPTAISLATNGVPTVDGFTGAPDVHVAAADGGVIRAFYSQDIGAVSNWGIQIVDFDANGNVLDVPPVIVLTPRQFAGSFGSPFGPANFPVESEFLNNFLYVAHFALPGIEVIDLLNDNTISQISLDYEPTNIGTDGTSLFIVGVTNNSVDVIDPQTGDVVDSFDAALEEATGVAASATHIAVADRTLGLVVITR